MLLPCLVLFSFFGGLLSWCTEIFSHRAPRLIAFISSIFILIFSMQPLLHGEYYSLCTSNGILQWKEVFLKSWIPSLGINVHFAIDGLSLLMLVLTAIIGVFSVLSNWNEKLKNQGFYYFNLLWIITCVIGIFISIDLFLFFFFWEMLLIPIYLITVNWGHKASENKKHINAAIKFFIYTQASGLFMLLSIIGLVIMHFKTTGVLTFNYNDLLGTKMSSTVSYILMLGFFVAFAVKMPLLPFHGWVPDIQEQLPTSGSIDISGIMLKTAAYGQLRFILPFFPETIIKFAPIAMTIGVVSIFYGAWLAFKQTDIKRLIAYANISHMGLVTIAIYANSILSYQGAVLQMITSSLSGTALILISNQLYERIQTRDMCMIGGLWGKIKLLPGMSLFFIAANFGIPGTGNFIAELMIFFGAFTKFKSVICIAILGVIFTSIYSLLTMQKIYYGTSKILNKMKNLSIREFGMLFVLAVLLLIIGFYAQLILNISTGSMKALYNFL
ncbi:NADH-quinone oxidoreductase subunit M [Candidatus Providencia siddallii]|uniref:NADH-quinone oxidoreductase subunit M n=1 Tax=Candidatus Providencia siddallii TaxID=1715285 RepID=A0A0M6W913_9GAMM|nr:NADH-quinone oxidoreductase subunit M [Candidatus Providencia siddallii]